MKPTQSYLDKTNGKPISDTLRLDILAYYAATHKEFATKKNPEAWQRVLDRLNSLKTNPAAADVPTNSVRVNSKVGRKSCRDGTVRYSFINSPEMQ